MLKISTARSTTQTSAASRRVSVQIEHGDCSVRDPQISQNFIFSRALRITAARYLTLSLSAWTRWRAMRSAERGPMPGNLPSAAIRAVIRYWQSGSGSISRGRADLMRRDFALSELAISLAWPSAWLAAAARACLFENLSISRIQRLGVDFDGGDSAIAFGGHFHAPAAARLNCTHGKFGFTSSICCCIRAACLINFPILEHIVSGGSYRFLVSNSN